MNRLSSVGHRVATGIAILMIITILDDPKSDLSESDKKKLLKRRDDLKKELDNERATARAAG